MFSSQRRVGLCCLWKLARRSYQTRMTCLGTSLPWFPSLVLSFANYVRVGTGVAITETSGPVQTQWLLLFGLGSDFGGSPKYQQTQLKAMAERASAGAGQ